MCSLLLKKALPFALTFVVGSLVVSLFGAFGARPWKSERRAARYYRHYGACDHGRGPARYLVAETKPLAITFKPDAMLPASLGALAWGVDSVTANVTFGADGKVRGVAPGADTVSRCAALSDKAVVARECTPKLVWDAVERAARQIQFEPETENGLPQTVTKDVKIRLTVN